MILNALIYGENGRPVYQRPQPDHFSTTFLEPLFRVRLRQYLVEYCSVALSPHRPTLIKKIKCVQKKILCCVGIRMGFDFRKVPLVELLAFLNTNKQ
ncbi:hypothetical protein J6590_078580 [Homalodisca vitripennis]|nr:hypothetical protein J6590_078580 [Homalodisca vitripennis]